MASVETAGRGSILLGALALFVVTPIAAIVLTGFNVWRGSEVGDRAVAQEAVLGQIEQRIAAGASGLRGGGDMSAVYLTASSGALAKAELQQHVGVLIEHAAARLIEVRAQDEDTQENGRVHLQVTMDATNASLFDVLYEIETGLPLLSIEQIGIRKVPSRTGAPDIDPSLRVTLIVRGHWSGAVK